MLNEGLLHSATHNGRIRQHALTAAGYQQVFMAVDILTALKSHRIKLAVVTY
jgi:hypothetical protein